MSTAPNLNWVFFYEKKLWAPSIFLLLQCAVFPTYACSSDMDCSSKEVCIKLDCNGSKSKNNIDCRYRYDQTGGWKKFKSLHVGQTGKVCAEQDTSVRLTGYNVNDTSDTSDMLTCGNAKSNGKIGGKVMQTTPVCSSDTDCDSGYTCIDEYCLTCHN